MQLVAQCISWAALAGLASAAGLFYADCMTLAEAQRWMLALTVVWFAVTPLWMEHKARG